MTKRIAVIGVVLIGLGSGLAQAKTKFDEYFAREGVKQTVEIVYKAYRHARMCDRVPGTKETSDTLKPGMKKLDAALIALKLDPEDLWKESLDIDIPIVEMRNSLEFIDRNVGYIDKLNAEDKAKLLYTCEHTFNYVKSASESVSFNLTQAAEAFRRADDLTKKDF